MGPLITQGIISGEWNSMLAFLIGLGFGISLEQAGFSSSRKLIGIFYGYDFVVLRVFLTAALTASVGLIYFHYLGWIDLEMVYINPTFVWSAIIGGAFAGVGIILGGYCPGTSFTAASIGKIDAMAYIGGIFVGILFYAETYSFLWKDLHEMTPLGKVKIFDSLGISQGLFAFLFIVFSLVIFFASFGLQRKFSNRKLKY